MQSVNRTHMQIQETSQSENEKIETINQTTPRSDRNWGKLTGKIGEIEPKWESNFKETDLRMSYLFPVFPARKNIIQKNQKIQQIQPEIELGIQPETQEVETEFPSWKLATKFSRFPATKIKASTLFVWLLLLLLLQLKKREKKEKRKWHRNLEETQPENGTDNQTHQTLQVRKESHFWEIRMELRYSAGSTRNIATTRNQVDKRKDKNSSRKIWPETGTQNRF